MAKHLICEFDGGSRGNPGPAGFGVVVRDDRDVDTPIITAGRFIGVATNNVAEYRGLIFALEQARDLGADQVTIRGDSELVIKQMKGQYRVKNAGLKPLYEQAQKIFAEIKAAGRITLEHNLRDQNKLADKLANLAMDRRVEVNDVLD